MSPLARLSTPSPARSGAPATAARDGAAAGPTRGRDGEVADRPAGRVAPASDAGRAPRASLRSLPVELLALIVQKVPDADVHAKGLAIRALELAVAPQARLALRQDLRLQQPRRLLNAASELRRKLPDGPRKLALEGRLLPFLSPARRDGFIAQARGVEDKLVRARKISSLFIHAAVLDDARQSRATALLDDLLDGPPLDHADAIAKRGQPVAIALRGLFRGAGHVRPAVITRALDCLDGLDALDGRLLLTALRDASSQLRHFDAAQLTRLVDVALRLDGENERAEAIATFGEHMAHLSALDRRRLCDALDALEDPDARAWVIDGLASGVDHLDVGQPARLAKAGLALPRGPWREQALAHLCARLGAFEKEMARQLVATGLDEDRQRDTVGSEQSPDPEDRTLPVAAGLLAAWGHLDATQRSDTVGVIQGFEDAADRRLALRWFAEGAGAMDHAEQSQFVAFAVDLPFPEHEEALAHVARGLHRLAADHRATLFAALRRLRGHGKLLLCAVGDMARNDLHHLTAVELDVLVDLVTTVGEPHGGAKLLGAFAEGLARMDDLS